MVYMLMVNIKANNFYALNMRKNIYSLKNLYFFHFQVSGIEVISIDISNWKEVEKIVKSLGPFDFLVNNAGIASLQNVGEITEEEFDR